MPTLESWRKMASGKWNSSDVARQIVDAARQSAYVAERSPEAGGFALLERFADLDDVDLQSLAVRLGQYAWKRRIYRDDLNDLSAGLLRQEADPARELTATQRACLSAANAVAQALVLGEESVLLRGDPIAVRQVARQVTRLREDERVLDGALVRSLLEPLLSDDRAAFRQLLGALGASIVWLDAMALDGRLPNLRASLGYQELRALQGVLNGVLRASRAGVGVAARRGLATA
jgi:hypothetical protein